MAARAAVQPRGSLPLLARRVVRPLVRRRVRRPRVHRSRRRYAARRLLARPARRHAPRRRGPRHRAASERRRRALPRPCRHGGRGHGRRVHPHRPARAAAAHGDQRPRRRQVVHDPERLLRPGAQDLHAVQPARGGSTTTRSTHGVTVTDLAIRNVVYTPAGQDPSIEKGVIIASYAWEQDSMAYSMLDEPPADRPGARGPRADPPRGRARRSSSASRTTGRSTAMAAASGRCSGRSR